MAFDKTPTEWVAFYSSDPDSITIHRDSLPPLTEDDADDATGDIRKIFYALCWMMFTAQQGQDVADRPSQMRFLHNSSLRSESPSGITRSHSFIFTFDTEADAIANEGVKDEPV